MSVESVSMGKFDLHLDLHAPPKNADFAVFGGAAASGIATRFARCMHSADQKYIACGSHFQGVMDRTAGFLHQT